jgi:hypothetical protein
VAATRYLASKLSEHALRAVLPAGLVGVLGVWVWSAYVGRGEWYAHHASSLAIFLSALLATAATFVAFGYLFDRERRRWVLTWATPGVLAIVAVLYIPIRWFVPWPTLDGVREAVAAKDFVRAHAELSAFDQRHPLDPEALAIRASLQDLEPDARTLADDQRLSQVGDVSLAVATALVVDRSWHAGDKQAEARRRVLARARATADAHWQQRNEQALEQLLADTAGLDATFSKQLEHRTALAWAMACLEQARMECVNEALAKLDNGEPLAAELITVEAELRARLPAAEIQ